MSDVYVVGTDMIRFGRVPHRTVAGQRLPRRPVDNGATCGPAGRRPGDLVATSRMIERRTLTASGRQARRWTAALTIC